MSMSKDRVHFRLIDCTAPVPEPVDVSRNPA